MKATRPKSKKPVSRPARKSNGRLPTAQPKLAAGEPAAAVAHGLNLWWVKNLIGIIGPGLDQLIALAGPSVIPLIFRELTPILRKIPAEFRPVIDAEMHKALIGDLQPGSLAGR